MWGNLLQSVGNLVTGHGFESNSDRARLDAQNATTTTTQAIQRPQVQARPLNQPFDPTAMLPKLNVPTNVVPLAPNPQQQLTSKLPTSGAITLPNNLSVDNYKGHDITGLSEENKAQARHTIDNARPGADLNPYLASAKNAQATQSKSDWENSIPGKALGFLGGIPDAVNKVLVEPVHATVNAGADLLAGGVGRITNNTGLVSRADKALGENFNKSILAPLNFIAPLGASIAYNEQYNKINSDPTTTPETKQWLLSQLEQSTNEATAPAGVSTDQSQLANAGNIALGAGGTALLATTSAKPISDLLRAPADAVLSARAAALRNSLNVNATAEELAAHEAAAGLKPTVKPVAETPAIPVTPETAGNPGAVPAKPQAVVALDSGGSISAPVRPPETPPVSVAPPRPVEQPIPAVRPPEPAPTPAPQLTLDELNQMATRENPALAPAIQEAPKPEIPAVAAPEMPKTPVEIATEQAAQNTPITPVEATPVEAKLGVTSADTADSALAKLEEAHANGTITEAEYQAADKELFDKYSKTGDVIAQTAKNDKAPKIPRGKAPEAAPIDPKVSGDLNGSDFGKLTQEAAAKGHLADNGSEAVSHYVEARSAQYAAEKGVNTEAVLTKIQAANRNGAKSFDQIGLNPAEKDWFMRDQQERNFLRDRAGITNEPSGYQKFHSPQQTPDTPYTSEMVNENKRANQIPLGELDNSGKPSQQYIQRYGDAGKSITDKIVHSIENIPDKTSETGFKESGIKVPKETQDHISQAATDYVDKFDNRLNADNPIPFKEATKSVSDSADEVVKRAIEFVKSQPSTPQTEAALAELAKGRGSYVHTYVESNMLGQIGGRLADQINKGIIRSMDIITGRATGAISEKMTGVHIQPKTGEGRQVARAWAKGSNLANIKQEFNTNRTLLSTKAKTGFGKTTAVSRSATTAAVRLADMGTSNARKTVGYFVRQAEDSGITGKVEINKYVAQKIASNEYKDALQATESVTNQDIALSASRAHGNVQSNNFGLHSAGKWIDSLPKALAESKAGQASPMFNKVVQSGVLRFVTGFAKVTATAASRGIDAATAGIPTYVRGFKALKMAETDAERIVAARTVQQGITDTIAGGGFVALGVAMADSYTGDYPTDPKERARWEQDGIQANTFRIPTGKNDKGEDTYMSVQPGRLGAYSLPIVMGASLASGKNTNPAAVTASLVSQFSSNFGLDQTGNMFDAASKAIAGDWTNAGKSLKTIGTSIANGFIPASGALNEVANATDRVKRDTGSLLNGFVAKLPGLRNTLAPKTDTFGNAMQNPNVGLGSWLTFGQTPKDPLYQEIDRLHSVSNIEASPANDKYSIKANDGSTIQLDAAQQADLTKTVQQEKQHQAELIIATPEYQAADDKAKSTMLSGVYGLDSSGTANTWAAKAGITGVKTNGDTINNTISDTSQTALVTHDALTADQRKVWLEDNTNALNYLQGTADNKNANGTLTSKDKDMHHTGSLAQQIAIAGVNKKGSMTQDGINAYADTSSSEFNKLAEGDMKNGLMAYDQALVAAGLPSKYQNKYGGYGSTAGSGKNSFAGLSFAKPLTAKGAAGINATALTTSSNPFAGLVKTAPTTQTNLKRNISVSRGVQL